MNEADREKIARLIREGKVSSHAQPGDLPIETGKAATKEREFTHLDLYTAWAKHAPDKDDEGELIEGGFILNWGVKGCGFGQLTIKQEGGRLICWSETMGRNFVRAALAHLAEKVEIVE